MANTLADRTEIVGRNLESAPLLCIALDDDDSVVGRIICIVLIEIIVNIYL